MNGEPTLRFDGGLVALVTGAGRGSSAVAPPRLLAAHGAAVVVNDGGGAAFAGPRPS